MRKNLILVSTSDYLSTHENGIYNFFTRQGSEKLVNHRLRTAHRLDEIARLSSRSQSFGYFKRNSLSLVRITSSFYYTRRIIICERFSSHKFDFTACNTHKNFCKLWKTTIERRAENLCKNLASFCAQTTVIRQKIHHTIQIRRNHIIFGEKYYCWRC